MEGSNIKADCLFKVPLQYLGLHFLVAGCCVPVLNEVSLNIITGTINPVDFNALGQISVTNVCRPWGEGPTLSWERLELYLMPKRMDRIEGN